MPRILVIEDNDSTRKMVRRVLERAGYSVTEAADGKESIRLFRKLQADLVITDIFMPELDGLSTITSIRRDFPGTRIVAMSGGSQLLGDSYIDHAIELGAANIIKKPFTPTQLLQAVVASQAGQQMQDRPDSSAGCLRLVATTVG
jgi:CheY-like chemotaxis protein